MTLWLGPYLVACVLLVAAGSSKVFRPAGTARAVSALFPRVGHRVAEACVRAAAMGEAALGAVALAFPSRPAAVVVTLSYGAFTAFTLFVLLRKGVLATCGCFGEPDTPATRLHVVLTSVLAVTAGAFAWTGPAGSLLATAHARTAVGAVLLSAVGVTTYLAYLALTQLARLQASRARLPAGAHLSRQSPRPDEQSRRAPVAVTMTKAARNGAEGTAVHGRNVRLG